MINKEGFGIITVNGVILAAVLIAAWFVHSLFLWILAVVLAALFVFHFFFFRDPERTPPENDNSVIAPADGKIIKIDTVKEELYINEEVQLVSIFMSVFNVHVNRIPVSGTVEWLEHREGKFLAAWADEAIEHNEQTIIGINSVHGKILFRQIAGLIARRIVCKLKPGDRVEQGNRFGIIKYGSRVDLYLPQSVSLRVSVGQAVKAGESVIGEFTS